MLLAAPRSSTDPKRTSSISNPIEQVFRSSSCELPGPSRAPGVSNRVALSSGELMRWQTIFATSAFRIDWQNIISSAGIYNFASHRASVPNVRNIGKGHHDGGILWTSRFDSEIARTEAKDLRASTLKASFHNGCTLKVVPHIPACMWIDGAVLHLSPAPF